MKKFIQTIKLKEVPKQTMVDGLLVRFTKGTKTESEFAFTDIQKGQQTYSLPEDKREIKGVYKKIN